MFFRCLTEAAAIDLSLDGYNSVVFTLLAILIGDPVDFREALVPFYLIRYLAMIGK